MSDVLTSGLLGSVTITLGVLDREGGNAAFSGDLLSARKQQECICSQYGLPNLEPPPFDNTE